MTDTSRTIPGLLRHRAEQSPHDPAFMKRDPKGRWRALTWSQFHERSHALARALVSAGIVPGSRAAILMPNCPDWEVVQHGALMAGCEVVGLEPGMPGTHLAAVLEPLRPRVLALEAHQVPAALQTLDSHLIRDTLILSTSRSRQASDINALIAGVPGHPLSPLPEVGPDHPAIRIFTSGTTGPPKALAYTHGQVVFAARSISRTLGPGLPGRARSACWLPLSSPFQRMVNYCGLILNLVTFMVPSPGDLPSRVREIRPHFLAGVPRFYEKVYDSVREQVAAHPDNRLASRHIRSAMGGSVRFMLSGSAPLDPAIPRRFADWGWPLLESYGISENLLPMAMNTPDNPLPGSVGKPLPGNTVKIGPGEEIMVRGCCLARGIPLDRNGYFKTGDSGYVDDAGFLHLTGRLSDLFKLSTGRKIAPQDIETAIRGLDGVDHAVVCGAGRKFTAALVNLSGPAWDRWVRDTGTPARAGQALVDQIRRACQRGRAIPAYAVPVRALVVPGTFSPDTGELTTSLKLRRNHVLDLFREDLDMLYNTSTPFIIRRQYP